MIWAACSEVSKLSVSVTVRRPLADTSPSSRSTSRMSSLSSKRNALLRIIVGSSMVLQRLVFLNFQDCYARAFVTAAHNSYQTGGLKPFESSASGTALNTKSFKLYAGECNGRAFGDTAQIPKHDTDGGRLALQCRRFNRPQERDRPNIETFFGRLYLCTMQSLLPQ